MSYENAKTTEDIIIANICSINVSEVKSKSDECYYNHGQAEMIGNNFEERKEKIKIYRELIKFTSSKQHGKCCMFQCINGDVKIWLEPNQQCLNRNRNHYIDCDLPQI